MSGLELVFAVIGVAGFVVLLVGFFVGDVFDLDADTDPSLPDWLNLPTIAVSAVGFGAFGWSGLYFGFPALVAVLCAIVGLLAVGALAFLGMLRPIMRMQSSMQLGQQSYVGLEAKVLLPISSGDWGTVEFADRNGAIVRKKAWSDSPEIPAGSRVYIYEINNEGVLVMPAQQELE